MSNGDGDSPTHVHVPPTLMFDVLKAVNGMLTRYESEWGEIKRPRRQQGGNGEQE